MAQEAVQIIEINSNNEIQLNVDLLENLLNRPEIKDRIISVISIAGAVRKGKSFILNFFLRYLKATYANNENDNWIGNEDEPLNGFSWRGGTERNTIGILVWPEVFLLDCSNGKKIAILVIDTQGTFDSKTTMNGNVSIFALSTLISSLQIYNISNNIQEDQLQYLQLFADYGKQAFKNPLNKPFQKLLFLVRDWYYPYESPYGYIGGRNTLKAVWETHFKTEENNDIRKNIATCFETLDCYLMPYPGSIVATSPNFKGNIKDIDNDFIKSLNELIPSILAPRNIITKKVNGVEITAQEFPNYLRAYFKILNGNTLPTPKNILSTTAEVQNLSAIEHAKKLYQCNMESAVINSNHYHTFEEMKEMHRKNNNDAIEKFIKTPKLQCNDKTSEEYEIQLENGLEKDFNYYLISNEKNRPDLNPKIDELITVITNEKSVSENLNDQNTKLLLDMINTMNTSLEEYRKEVNQMIQAFKKSKKSGFDFAGILKDVISIVPHVIQLFVSKKK